MNVVAACSLAVAGITASSGAVGTWTAVTANAPATSGGGMILLSDGTVLCKSFSGGADGYGNIWMKLTPSSTGSYTAGTWSTLGTITPMLNTRLYFSSQLLMDGRLYVAGGEYGTGGSSAEVYDPIANTWTACPAPGGVISDANTEILPDGRVMQAMVNGTLRTTKIYNPTTNTFINGPTCTGIHNESVWNKLPDNSIIFVNRLTTQSERYFPATNTWVNDATVPVALYDSFGLECGGGALMPNGKLYFSGSPGTAAIYTPTGNNTIGSWVAAPVPNNGANLGAPDAPLAMMSDGKILLLVSPVPTSANHFPSPTTFWEYDYVSNSYASVTTPTGAASINSSAYVFTLLDLPDGNVLYSQQGSNKYYVYKPSGQPQNSWRPTITSLDQNNCGDYTLTGTQFNGISEGASYGDDWQMNTNYPIVRMTSGGGTVYYCRTYNWNLTGVATGAATTTTKFKVPAGVPAGTYSLVVSANGIASAPFSFAYSPSNSCDINGDGVVDGADLGLLLLYFGPCAGCPADIDMDGVVDSSDLGLLLLSYGPCQ